MGIPVLPIDTKILIVACEAERSGITNKNTSRAGRDLAKALHTVTVRDVVDRGTMEPLEQGRIWATLRNGGRTQESFTEETFELDLEE